ncbi:MAG: ATP-binding protein [Bacteroidota bacterium]
MQPTFVGRKEEQIILRDALRSKEAEMVAVIGRRRVGKTFLVTTVCKKQIAFNVTGIQNGALEDQLNRFSKSLKKYANTSIDLPPPKNWFQAFDLLQQYIETLPKKQKHVIFIDELPWLAPHKSKFLQAFGHFWNDWASRQNLVVVICGSAASWMIQKVVNNTGGLYNRITKRIFLQPFTLSETEAYLKAKRFKFTRYQIVQLYMAMGGIPHYLKEVKRGKSATQNINDICFSRNGLLRDEFLRLYPSLFPNTEKHFKVIRALAKKREGLTRQEIIKKAKLTDGGGLTTVLDELSHSGFITPYQIFHQKKGKVYRLTDEYSLFYLKFIEDKALEGEDIWQYLSQTNEYKSWSGYAFENICLKHIPQIKVALGISGIYSLSSTFYKKGTAKQQGLQIDLLMDRKDHVINLFEIKFFNKTFTISKSYADHLRKKMWRFEEITKTKKQIIWVLISTFGLNENAHSLDMIGKSLTLDDLF